MTIIKTFSKFVSYLITILETLMAIQTLDLQKMHDKNLNIYEACLLISARARQINSVRLEEKKENEWLFHSVERHTFYPRNDRI